MTQNFLAHWETLDHHKVEARNKVNFFLISKNLEVANTFGRDFAANNQDSGYQEFIFSLSSLFEIKSFFGFLTFNNFLQRSE